MPAPLHITLKLDSAEFRKNIRRLTDREVNLVMAKAINRTAFEVLDSEKEHAGSVFKLGGAGPRRYFAGKGAFVFDKARAVKLEATIKPGRGGKDPERRERLLRQHRSGARVTAAQGGRLVVGRSLAVPLDAARRSVSGKVPKRLLPRTLMASGGKGFVAGRAVLMRLGRGRNKRLVAVFALTGAAQLKPVFEFYRVARDTARKEFGKKAKLEFERLRGRFR
jgi:hypothetical protein